MTDPTPAQRQFDAMRMACRRIGCRLTSRGSLAENPDPRGAMAEALAELTQLLQQQEQRDEQ